MSESHSATHLTPGEGESVWLVGDLITVKVTSQDTDGAFTLVEEKSPPLGGPPPHFHQHVDEALYVLEGEVEFLLEDRTIPAGAGSCVYAPRGILHTWTNVGSSPSRMLAVITPGGLERFFLEAGERVTDASSPPPGPPNIEKIMEAAARYGVEIPPPPDL